MSRPETYRKIREQDRRDKISISKHLRKLSDIQEELQNKPDDINVSALRLSADISLSLLKKRLPDLKAIEHSGSIGDKQHEEMNVAELTAELAATRERINASNQPGKRAAKSSRVRKNDIN